MNANLSLKPFAARWQPLARLPGGAVPRLWRHWLADRGSLTQRLVALSGGEFEVRVLRQAVAQPDPGERRALGLGHRRFALIREVVLLGGDRPWVYARSVLPLTTLTGRLRFLRRLDNRPLGDLIFRYHTLRRDQVSVARLSGRSLPHGLAAPEDRLWARRSVFHIDGKPLLVGETFLPDFVAVAVHSPPESLQ